MFWSVNGTTLSIPPNHRVEDGRITNSGYIASLVKLNLTSENVGDRTSLLRVAPATTNFNTIVTVACSGGDPVNTCSRDILFIGNTTLYHVSSLGGGGGRHEPKSQLFTYHLGVLTHPQKWM